MYVVNVTFMDMHDCEVNPLFLAGRTPSICRGHFTCTQRRAGEDIETKRSGTALDRV